MNASTPDPGTDPGWAEVADYRVLFEQAPVPIWITGPDGRVLAGNAAAGKLLGYDTARLEGREAESLFVDPAEHTALERGVAEQGSHTLDVRLRRHDGTEVSCAIAAAARRGRNGEVLGGYQAFARDISSHRRAVERLLHDALHDALTGLPNRTIFKDRLEGAIRRAQRHQDYLYAVLFLDLDRFKVVNDSLGHLVGDELLILVAAKLKACLRDVDTVARFGGDEFAILLDGIDDAAAASQVAERIHELLRPPLTPSGHEVFTSASIGVALSHGDYHSPDEILRDADIAMYHAKEMGRGSFAVFTESMRAEVEALLQLETDLTRALKNRQFVVHYQPIVSLDDGRLIGFEALLRWDHPTHGLLYPDSFLHVAEETGLIVPIGWWMFEASCTQLKEWRQVYPLDPPLMLSVNVSGKQLFQPDSVDTIIGILRKVGIEGEGLAIEITEHAIMGDTETANTALRRLKAEGIRLSIDDFGTGYSSLGYLHRFPFDTVKIDRSFVGELDKQGGNPELVWSIATLAHNLGMNVVGEGVETSDQLEELRVLRCEFVQGNLFSRALDGREAEALLSYSFRPPPEELLEAGVTGYILET